MARIAGLAFAVAVLTVFAMVAISSAQESIEVTLDSLEGSDIHGTATLNRTDAGYTEVIMVGNGLDPDGAPHINHIHDGTGCGEGEYGAPVVTLPPLADTDPVSDGIMVGINIVTETDAGDPISFEEIADGNHVVILHDVEGAPAACGAIPALVSEETGEEEGEMTASPEKAPVVGSGGYLDGNGGAGLMLLLAAMLATFGIVALGAAFAVRRAGRAG